MTISLDPAIIGCFESTLTSRRFLKYLPLKHLVILAGFSTHIIIMHMIIKIRIIRGMRRNIAQSFPPSSFWREGEHVKLSRMNPKVVVSDMLCQKNGMLVRVLASDSSIVFVTNRLNPSNRTICIFELQQ